jgi:hypothetical protein
MCRKSVCSIFFVLTILFGCVLVESISLAGASTLINGIIKSDTTWTKTNSPYELTGPLGIMSGVTLTIEPGTTINLVSNFLDVNGTLIARGTTADPIIFDGGFLCLNSICTGWDEKTGQGSIIEHAVATKIFCDGSPKITNSRIWDLEISGGAPLVENNVFTEILHIADNSTAKISGNTIEHDVNADLFWSSKPVLTNNHIDGGINVGGYGSIVIANNTIGTLENVVYQGTSIEVSHVHADIIGNYINGYVTVEKGGQIIGDTRASATISNNVFSGSGIRLQGSGIIENNLIKDVTGGTAIEAANDATINNNTITNCDVCIAFSGDDEGTHSVSFNNFIGYKTNSLKWGSSNEGDAKNNCWGTTDSNTISQSIYDNKNNYNLGAVNFTPFLTQANPQAAPYIDPNGPVSTPTVTQTPTATQNQQYTQPPTQYSTPEGNQATTQTSPQSQTQSEAYYLETALFAAFIISISVAGLVFFVRKSKAS